MIPKTLLWLSTTLAIIFCITIIKPAYADLPIVIQNLQNTPATLFDIGMKQLRRQALTAATRLSSDDTPKPSTRVWLKKDSGTIEILFLFSASSDSGVVPTQHFCAQFRAIALKEIFRIGRTAYDIELSDEARIARRLGTFFSSEPVRGSKDAIAMGQRLSELTYLEVKIENKALDLSVICRDPVNTIFSKLE